MGGWLVMFHRVHAVFHAMDNGLLRCMHALHNINYVLHRTLHVNMSQLNTSAMQLKPVHGLRICLPYHPASHLVC
jgi:hypothetical protein